MVVGGIICQRKDLIGRRFGGDKSPLLLATHECPLSLWYGGHGNWGEEQPWPLEYVGRIISLSKDMGMRGVLLRHGSWDFDMWRLSQTMLMLDILNSCDMNSISMHVHVSKSGETKGGLCFYKFLTFLTTIRHFYCLMNINIS